MRFVHAALFALLLSASPALARPVASVEVPETLSFEGRRSAQRRGNSQEGRR